MMKAKKDTPINVLYSSLYCLQFESPTITIFFKKSFTNANAEEVFLYLEYRQQPTIECVASRRT